MIYNQNTRVQWKHLIYYIQQNTRKQRNIIIRYL